MSKGHHIFACVCYTQLLNQINATMLSFGLFRRSTDPSFSLKKSPNTRPKSIESSYVSLCVYTDLRKKKKKDEKIHFGYISGCHAFFRAGRYSKGKSGFFWHSVESPSLSLSIVILIKCTPTPICTR